MSWERASEPIDEMPLIPVVSTSPGKTWPLLDAENYLVVLKECESSTFCTSSRISSYFSVRTQKSRKNRRNGFVHKSALFDDFLKNLLGNDSFARMISPIFQQKQRYPFTIRSARYVLQTNERLYLKTAVLIIS